MSHDEPPDRHAEALGCEGARARILEAGPAELRGEGGGPLARHLATCADCRARAERTLSVSATLDAALEARVAAGARPVGDVLQAVWEEIGREAVPRRAMATGGRSQEPAPAPPNDELGAPAEGDAGGYPDGPKAPRAAIRWKVVLPLAAAALAVGVALWPRVPESSPYTRPGATAPRGGTVPGPLVTGAPAFGAPAVADGRRWDAPLEIDQLHVVADRRFALMKTGDPTISVVWFY